MDVVLSTKSTILKAIPVVTATVASTAEVELPVVVEPVLVDRTAASGQLIHKAVCATVASACAMKSTSGSSTTIPTASEAAVSAGQYCLKVF